MDLKNKTLKELLKLKAEIDKQIGRLEKQEKKKALAAAEKAAGKLGFKLSEIIETKKPAKQPRATAKRKPPAKPKYAHPENPSVTWSGNGRQPVWFKEAIAAGKTPEDMAVATK